LHQSVRDLITLICDVKLMNNTMIELDLDIKKMPLGKLSKNQIKKGFEILKEIESLLNSSNSSHSKFVDCSNRFYTMIPHAFGMKPPPLINNINLLKAKMEMLEALSDMEIASKIIQRGPQINEHPIDTQYKALNTEISPVDQNSDEFKLLVKYVMQTHGPTHTEYTLSVEEIFQVKRYSEQQSFAPWKAHKRQLLWHGSRLTNWVGILSQGLRIAPPEAPVTGYMFGKGVYFADISSKSANYCFATKANPLGLLVLCEVATGNSLTKRRAEMISSLPNGYHSCLGEGQWIPDPNEAFVMENGCQVPLGHPVKSGLVHMKDTSLLYNEFIVYDTSQINVRYLLKIKFNFK